MSEAKQRTEARMGDLVERLRDYERWLTDSGYGTPSIDIDDIGPGETFGPAADEIERLRARVAELEAMIGTTQ